MACAHAFNQVIIVQNYTNVIIIAKNYPNLVAIKCLTQAQKHFNTIERQCTGVCTRFNMIFFSNGNFYSSHGGKKQPKQTPIKIEKTGPRNQNERGIKIEYTTTKHTTPAAQKNTPRSTKTKLKTYI